MSQYPQAPSPGGYVPPTETTRSSQGPGFNPQQSQYSQQSQAPSPYQPSAPNYVPPATSHKTSSKAAFGKMFDQAVTTGKPMLDKLGKTLNSKLGGKSQGQSTPQHLQSYQSYQNHHQQSNQQQGQSFSPQTQQGQWGQPAQQQQSSYNTPQQSPYPPSNYATPASGHSGQSNYFGHQSSQPPNPQGAPAPQYGTQSYSTGQPAQGQYGGFQQQSQPQGQFQQSQPHGQFQQGQSQGQFQQSPFGQQPPQGHPSPGQYGQGPQDQSGQQTGVIGTSQSPTQQVSPVATPGSFVQPNQQPQYQQGAPPPLGPSTTNVNSQNVPAPPSSQPGQSFNATAPPQQFGAAPALPAHPNQPQLQQQQHQGAPVSPMSPQAQLANPISPAASPPPVQSPLTQHQSIHLQPTPSPQPATAPKPSVPSTAPTEFVAELPADLGNLSIVEQESSKPQRPSASQYQAYQPPGQTPSPSQSFTIRRRAVSVSTLPLADPWRVADPHTELPTREFYIIADLIFDTMDRKYEPQDTGLIEASKLLESLKVLGLPEEVAQLFSHSSYTLLARLWALEGIPHILVPCTPQLMPTWSFTPQSQNQDVMRVGASGSANYPSYMPALNRAGWYKYLFIEQLAEGNYIGKLLSSPSYSDVYKPSQLNQPDLAKCDGTELPSLANRARALRQALSRVCDEVVAEMGRSQDAARMGQGAHQTQKNAQQVNSMAGQTSHAGASGQHPAFSLASSGPYIASNLR